MIDSIGAARVQKPFAECRRQRHFLEKKKLIMPAMLRVVLLAVALVAAEEAADVISLGKEGAQGLRRKMPGAAGD